MGDGFCVRRKGGTGRWVDSCANEGQNSMAMSGLGYRTALGGPFLSSFANGLKTPSSGLVQPLFQVLLIPLLLAHDRHHSTFSGSFWF